MSIILSKIKFDEIDTNIKKFILTNTPNILNYIDEYKGIWYEIKRKDLRIYGSFFKAENIILDTSEGYSNIYINTEVQNFDYSKIVDVLNDIKADVENLQIPWINFHIFHIEHLFSIEKVENFFREFTYKSLSLVISKQLTINSTESRNTDVIIRLANDCDDIYIKNCTTQAYLNGTSPLFYEHIGIDKFLLNVDKFNEYRSEYDNFKIVAEYNKEFVGYIEFDFSGTSINANPGKAEMFDVYVLEKFKGKGFENQLIKAAESSCIENGYFSLIGTVDIMPNEFNRDIFKAKKLINDSWKISSISIAL